MKRLALVAVLLAMLLMLTGCGSSYSYTSGYEQWKKDNNYDRKYSNEEITDFVNSYGNKW